MPQGLAVDGDVSQTQLPPAGVQPAAQTALQAAWRQGSEEALEGAARGDAVGQGQEGLQPVLTLYTEGHDLGPVLGSGKHGAQSNGDDVQQQMFLLPPAASRTAQAREALPDGN
jgi:hypothetical protein